MDQKQTKRTVPETPRDPRIRRRSPTRPPKTRSRTWKTRAKLSSLDRSHPPRLPTRSNARGRNRETVDRENNQVSDKGPSRPASTSRSCAASFWTRRRSKRIPGRSSVSVRAAPSRLTTAVAGPPSHRVPSNGHPEIRREDHIPSAVDEIVVGSHTTAATIFNPTDARVRLPPVDVTRHPGLAARTMRRPPG